MVIFLEMLLAGAFSVMVVYTILRSADRIGLVQHVNDRSSHTKPTPTGGGIGVVVGTVAGGVPIYIGDWNLLLVLALALIVALIGLIDDRWPLPAKSRLAVQFVAVSTLVVIIAVPNIPSHETLDIGLIIVVLGLIFAGIWWLNLFNFMDGIDGFAISQSLFMLAGAIGLAMVQNKVPLTHPLIALMIVLAFASLGFLAFNWPPAKIFMGDVGSTFLGFLIFALALMTGGAGLLGFWQWMILGALFATDATVTLVRRLIQQKNVMKAHKTHAYQHLTRQLGGHRPVTQTLIAINTVFILPLAWAAGHWPDQAWIIAGLAYATMGIGAVAIGSGRELA